MLFKKCHSSKTDTRCLLGATEEKSFSLPGVIDLPSMKMNDFLSIRPPYNLIPCDLPDFNLAEMVLPATIELVQCNLEIGMVLEYINEHNHFYFIDVAVNFPVLCAKEKLIKMSYLSQAIFTLMIFNNCLSDFIHKF